MSLLNDIANVVGTRPATGGSGTQASSTTGQVPGSTSAAASLQQRFGSTFSSTFNSTLATVYERGAAGEFDDRTLALEEQAAMQRLRQAQAAAGSTSPRVTGGGPTGGADAAPTADAAQGAADTSTDASVADEQREVYAVRVRQSEARLGKISSSLKQEFPKAAQLVSASTGTWDPATFVPKSKEQAEAFAQRLVIDATEAAARLEIVKTQLDAARFELAQGGGEQVRRTVADLEAAYQRQTAYVDKLAAIVDRQSGGMMTDAGTDAMQGRTMRGADDLPVDEIVAALREDGFTEEQITRLVGATETAVEEEKTPGGSVRLKQMASEMTRTLVNEFNAMVRRHEEEFQRQEQDRADRRRDDDKRLARKRQNERSQEQSHANDRQQQVAAKQAAEQRAAQRDAEFEQWMQQLAVRHSRAKRAG